MKRRLPILSITALIAVLLIAITSCQSKKGPDTPDSLVLSAADTAGLAEFQSWKQMNETKTASNYYMQGYKDAMTTKPATRTRAIYKTARPAVAQPSKKKGWSKAAKGTAIGTTAGAIAGALIDKHNRVVGGVIGGLLGGGVGYGVGRSMDKKDGRY